MSDTATYSAVPAAGNAATVGDFIELLKPRVMVLVVFTGIVGLLLAPGALHPVLAMVAVLFITIAAGAAGAINMWYERDIDAVMSRTRNRPLPQGRMDPSDALAFGVVLTLFSIALMGLALNWVAAGVLAFASFFYVFIYTIWLKRRTPQNIVIGGAAGAFPPVIGWAAVTGDVSLEAMMMFAIIFMWTPPHFWALALYKNGDYERAGVPMMPVVAGEGNTKKQILFYTVALFPFAIAPYFLGFAGIDYLIGASLLGLLFVLAAVRVLQDDTHRSSRRMFGYSIFYLFAIFALLLTSGLRVAGG